MQHHPKDKQNPREIPTRKDPDKNYPEKDPNIDPDLEPSEENPRNPKEDFNTF